MRKVVFLLIASLAIAFTACNKEKINKVNPADISVNLDKAALQQRVEMINAPLALNTFKSSADVTPVPELWAIAKIAAGDRTYSVYHWVDVDGAPTMYRTTATNVAPVVTIPATPTVPQHDITLVANTTDFPPAGEESITATLSMTGAGVGTNNGHQYAYFTSHVRGDVFGGEIFVVRYDDSDDDNIEAEVSIFDNTADYNDLTIDANTTLWVGGDNNARGAVIRNATLDDLHTLYGVGDAQQASALNFSMTEYNMPLLGPSCNSVSIFGDQLWVVAGGTSYGGIAVMDKADDTRLFTRSDRANAKHFDMGETDNGSGFYGAFLWGDGDFYNDKSNLRIFNTSAGPFAYTDYLAGDYGDVTFEGKNAIDVDDDDAAVGGTQHIYLAMGADGVKRVGTDGVVTHSFNGLDTFGGTGLANGLVVHGDFVYVAWGASGLVILNKADLTLAGQYNGIGSCNYVAVDTDGAEDILWAGFGTGGMIMLKFVDDVQ